MNLLLLYELKRPAPTWQNEPWKSSLPSALLPSTEAPLVLLRKWKKCLIRNHLQNHTMPVKNFGTTLHDSQGEQANETEPRGQILLCRTQLAELSGQQTPTENNSTGYQGFSIKLQELHFSRRAGTHTLGGDSSVFPINPSVPAHTRLCPVPGWSPPPMITLNTPGQDFGKYSQGHDRIQKAWNHFLEYLTQPKNICNEATLSKTKSYSAFSSV